MSIPTTTPTQAQGLFFHSFYPSVYTLCLAWSRQVVVNKCVKNASKDEAHCTVTDYGEAAQFCIFYSQIKYLN